MPKLLIVDDEQDVREFARSFFRKRSIDVFIASGGKEALEIISTQRPDLVLLDVRMEGLNGIEVMRELKRLNDNTRVIMVSGLEDDRIVEESKTLGALDFIHKPLVLEELEKVVKTEFDRLAPLPQTA